MLPKRGQPSPCRPPAETRLGEAVPHVPGYGGQRLQHTAGQGRKCREGSSSFPWVELNLQGGVWGVLGREGEGLVQDTAVRGARVRRGHGAGWAAGWQWGSC